MIEVSPKRATALPGFRANVKVAPLRWGSVERGFIPRISDICPFVVSAAVKGVKSAKNRAFVRGVVISFFAHFPNVKPYASRTNQRFTFQALEFVAE